MAFLILVNMSAIGSVETMSISFLYQLLLVTPGISPFEACSLNEILDSPNWRINALGRPVSIQRLVLRVGLELRGNLAKPSVSPIDLSSARLAAYFSIILILLASLTTIDFLAI
jgi:hypothetical protein